MVTDFLSGSLPLLMGIISRRPNYNMSREQIDLSDTIFPRLCHFVAGLGPQLDARPTRDQEVAGSTSPRKATFFVEIDHHFLR